jgi:hypothetical protein
MHKPPPRPYVLDENAAHCTTALELEMELEKKSTTREGTNKNTAPPAALLEPEAHIKEEDVDVQLHREQLFTTMTL